MTILVNWEKMAENSLKSAHCFAATWQVKENVISQTVHYSMSVHFKVMLHDIAVKGDWIIHVQCEFSRGTLLFKCFSSVLHFRTWKLFSLQIVWNSRRALWKRTGKPVYRHWASNFTLIKVWPGLVQLFMPLVSKVLNWHLIETTLQLLWITITGTCAGIYSDNCLFHRIRLYQHSQALESVLRYLHLNLIRGFRGQGGPESCTADARCSPNSVFM